MARQGRDLGHHRQVGGGLHVVSAAESGVEAVEHQHHPDAGEQPDQRTRHGPGGAAGAVTGGGGTGCGALLARDGHGGRVVREPGGDLVLDGLVGVVVDLFGLGRAQAAQPAVVRLGVGQLGELLVRQAVLVGQRPLLGFELGQVGRAGGDAGVEVGELAVEAVELDHHVVALLLERFLRLGDEVVEQGGGGAVGKLADPLGVGADGADLDGGHVAAGHALDVALDLVDLEAEVGGHHLGDVAGGDEVGGL